MSDLYETDEIEFLLDDIRELEPVSCKPEDIQVTFCYLCTHLFRFFVYIIKHVFVFCLQIYYLLDVVA